MAISDVVLSCHGIGYAYGDVPVLEDVSLELRQGECVAVLGQSGTGKTTLFNVLAGIDQPTTGEIYRATNVGYMLQKDLLVPWKRLIDNFSLPLLLQGDKQAGARNKARRYFELFGLGGLEHRYPFELSGGQLKRAAFLRTFLYSKGLMLLDEPFSGLDAFTREQMIEWLQQRKVELGLSILLVTHDIDEAIGMSDRLYVLKEGPPSHLWPSLHVPEKQEEIRHYLQVAELKNEVRRRIFSPILKGVE